MKKILIIEDDRVIRENILEIVEAENFKAIGAENGSLGLRLAKQNVPDLIICDVMMPELDGYGVLKELRKDPVTAAIPFIFLTALADRADTRKGMEMGADDYLTKPCTPQELLNAIATRLQKHLAITGAYTSALKQVSQELNKLAHYDILTNLPNRMLLQERFDRILQDWQKLVTYSSLKTADRFIPVFCTGIDRFNRIIEILGHSTGDLLIKAVAERLQNCVESTATVARLSTDEFAIVLTRKLQKQAIGEIAKEILESIAQPFLLEDGKEIVITVSIGISLYPRNGSNIGELLQSANKAMNYAKQRGGNLHEFYRTSFNIGSSDRLALETSLCHALEREELEVYYQPKVSLSTGQIVGAEALLRWHHPELGMISPDKFIPIAEENNLIIPIGEWVLKTACEQTKYWQKSGFTSLKIAVNLSGRQFDRANLRANIFQILIDTGLDPKYLELELTESILVQQPEVGVVRLTAFKALGVQIAIDDFGTGYSSLSYLHQFPFDTLKIDRCFVGNLTKDEKTKAITTAIIKIAHDLNLKLIAEGVETDEELAFLQANNCDEIQGYLFSRPLDSEEFEELLQSGKSLQISLPIESKNSI